MRTPVWLPTCLRIVPTIVVWTIIRSAIVWCQALFHYGDGYDHTTITFRYAFLFIDVVYLRCFHCCWRIVTGCCFWLRWLFVHSDAIVRLPLWWCYSVLAYYDGICIDAGHWLNTVFYLTHFVDIVSIVRPNYDPKRAFIIPYIHCCPLFRRHWWCSVLFLHLFVLLLGCYLIIVVYWHSNNNMFFLPVSSHVLFFSFFSCLTFLLLLLLLLLCLSSSSSVLYSLLLLLS